jgi:hypothetical protein
MKKFTIVLLIILSNTFIIKPCYAQEYFLINAVQETLRVGDTLLLLVNVDKNVAIWSSSDSGVATVSETGRVTAAAPGIALITAEFYGCSLSCSVNVVKTRISLSQSSALLPFTSVIYINTFTDKPIDVTYYVENKSILNCELGAMQDNSIPLIIKQTGIGTTTINIIAKYLDGQIEVLEIPVLSLDQQVPVIPDMNFVLLNKLINP